MSRGDRNNVAEHVPAHSESDLQQVEQTVGATVSHHGGLGRVAAESSLVNTSRKFVAAFGREYTIGATSVCLEFTIGAASA